MNKLACQSEQQLSEYKHTSTFEKSLRIPFCTFICCLSVAYKFAVFNNGHCEAKFNHLKAPTVDSLSVNSPKLAAR